MANKHWIERVLEHADDVPVPYNLPLSPVPRRLLEEHFETGDVEAHLDLPIRMTGLKSIKPLYAPPEQYGDRVVDEFGVAWTTNAIDRGVPIGPPLKKPSLDRYTFPDPAAEYRFQDLVEWCRRHEDHYTILWIGDLWERATFLCGMERLLLYVRAEPGFVGSLLDRITEYILDTLSILLQRFSFDGIALSDDYGTQRSLVMSPADWRRLVKPRLAAIFGRAKSAGKTVFLHSCGAVAALVPDLVELGLDILHPIQPEAMDILQLKREFGKLLTFCGGLGTQDTLVRATAEKIRREVRRLKKQMGRGGGYVLEPGITIQADVPLVNILALIDAARSAE
jgi:uroporphyrinogen decarboxylase